MIIRIAAVLAALSIGGSVSASAIAAEDMLKQFTVVALGDHESTSHMVGSVYVGGAFKAAQSINGGVDNATIGNVTGTLIVGGDVVGGGSVTVNGNVAVGGLVAAGTSVNMNNGSLAEGADVPTAEVAAAMHGLSGGLALLAETGGDFISGDSNNPRLNVGPAGADGFAVVHLAMAELTQLFAGNPGFIFNGNNPITTVINVAGTSFHQGSGRNLNGFAGSNNVIFNFHEATEIVLDSTFGASILAPNADIHVNAGGSDVFMVGNIFQKAQLRKPFTGDLPQPPDGRGAAAGRRLAACGRCRRHRGGGAPADHLNPARILLKASPTTAAPFPFVQSAPRPCPARHLVYNPRDFTDMIRGP